MHRSVCLFSIAGLLFVTACGDIKKPNNTNFAKAINEYLMKRGEACAVIGRQFPIDVLRPEQSEQYGIGPKLAALEQAGLVHATDTMAVVHGMLEPLRGSTSAQAVKRYELTEDGRKYFQQLPGALGQTSGFCYGQKSVDSIVKWTGPASLGTSSQAEVTYTYRIVDPAGWAERPEVQQAFSDIRTTVNGASKTTEVAGLQLTSKGWEVPGR
jgi:DNA-binding PadR family transcriptional regulator